MESFVYDKKNVTWRKPRVYTVRLSPYLVIIAHNWQMNTGFDWKLVYHKYKMWATFKKPRTKKLSTLKFGMEYKIMT